MKRAAPAAPAAPAAQEPYNLASMVQRLVAVVLSVLLALCGAGAAAWPATTDTSDAIAASAGLGWAASQVMPALGADEPAGGTDERQASPSAEPLFDANALLPLAQACFSSGMRCTRPARPAATLYQPPFLETPQRPPCASAR